MSMRRTSPAKGLHSILKPWFLACVAVICLGACSGVQTKESPIPEVNPAQAIKIVVDQEGLYGVSRNELKHSSSNDPLGNPDEWQLFHQGEAVNFWVEGEEQTRTLIFYGEPSASLYSRRE